MKRTALIVVVLLLAGAGWAGEGGWDQSSVTEPELSVAVTPIPPSGVTAWYGGGDFIYKWYMDHYRHPWPVRWYDAAMKWLKAHFWWPVGEAEAGEKPSLFEATIEDDADLANVIGRVKKEHPDCVTVSWSYDTEIRPDDVLRAFQDINYVRSGSATSDKTRTHSDDFVTFKRWLEGMPKTSAISWTDWSGDIAKSPVRTYPQLVRVPWDEVNKFLKDHAGEGWEYMESQYAPPMTVWRNGMKIEYLGGDFVILKRELRE